MFILSRDDIFLESNKNDCTIEIHFDNINMLANVKTYNEFDHEILHLQERFSFLDKSLKHRFEL